MKKKNLKIDFWGSATGGKFSGGKIPMKQFLRTQLQFIRLLSNFFRAIAMASRINSDNFESIT